MRHDAWRNVDAKNESWHMRRPHSSCVTTWSIAPRITRQTSSAIMCHASCLRCASFCGCRHCSHAKNACVIFADTCCYACVLRHASPFLSLVTQSCHWVIKLYIHSKDELVRNLNENRMLCLIVDRYSFVTLRRESSKQRTGRWRKKESTRMVFYCLFTVGGEQKCNRSTWL
jgi:hypothetical protein